MNRVVFNEFNVRLGKGCYLPLVSGLLRAYSETIPIVKLNYSFAPFLYSNDSLGNIVKAYDEKPDVAAFSVCIWNEQLSLAVAAEVKKRWPNCLIVFGGVQVPARATDYLEAYPFIDVTVRGEGEQVFARVLESALLSPNDFSGVPQVGYRGESGIIVNQADLPFKKELDDLPSPYLTGLYDDLIAQRSDDLEFQAIIETTRDCPFLCLSGDTPVNTIYGSIPIKELSETQTTVPVFTYSPETGDVFISDAFNIRKYGESKPLVRVTFDDATYIDCTPDHRFLAFGNYTKESPVEAADLKPGMSVRALRTEVNRYGYAEVESVVELDGVQDVYCLEVPATGWFFANDVLVKNCTFCFYGKASHKFKYHEMDRIFAEIDWIGRNKIAYLFNADSNFGMNHRDREIADFLVSTKNKYGYPDKFRTTFGKNADDKIYEIGLLMHQAKLEKGITLARQSNNLGVLKNVKRSNIKMSTYQNLQVKFNDSNVSVYSEFIMGLPGETLQTWKDGLDETVAAGMKNQCLVYPCMALVNTDMGDPEYQKKHGIIIKRIEIAEVHGARKDGWLKEYQDIVIGTSTLSVEDWKRTAIFSYVFMTMHGMKVLYFVLIYMIEQLGVKPSAFIDFVIANCRDGGVWRREINGYEKLLDGVINNGEPIAIKETGYGEIYWEPEEISFLHFSHGWNAVYRETAELIRVFLSGSAYIPDQLADVLAYQEERMPRLGSGGEHYRQYRYNVNEYFDAAFSSNPVPLEKRQCDVGVMRRSFTYFDDFAREVIMYGRKNNTLVDLTKEYNRGDAETLEKCAY
jgi:hypothetical protein